MALFTSRDGRIFYNALYYRGRISSIFGTNGHLLNPGASSLLIASYKAGFAIVCIGFVLSVLLVTTLFSGSSSARSAALIVGAILDAIAMVVIAIQVALHKREFIDLAKCSRDDKATSIVYRFVAALGLSMTVYMTFIAIDNQGWVLLILSAIFLWVGVVYTQRWLELRRAR